MAAREARRAELGPLDAGPETTGWLPILDVAPDQVDAWVASRRVGAWARGEGRRLGYRGWWQHSPGVVRADLSRRVLVHARHERGSLPWTASRTNRETPGESHKQTFAIVVESDDRGGPRRTGAPRRARASNELSLAITPMTRHGSRPWRPVSSWTAFTMSSAWGRLEG